MYQRINLAATTVDGVPAVLPAELAGLDDTSLADLSWVGAPLDALYHGFGYWPLEISDPDFDPATETLTDDFGSREPDAGRQVIVATRGVRPLTAEELAALNPVPASISDRQFAQQLAILGAISEAEAIAWAARGDLPAAIETAVLALPEGDRFAARMLLSSATIYERAHPLVSALGAILSYDHAAFDTLWREAAAL